jgi:hypothetical protein
VRWAVEAEPVLVELAQEEQAALEQVESAQAEPVLRRPEPLCVPPLTCTSSHFGPKPEQQSCALHWEAVMRR